MALIPMYSMQTNWALGPVCLCGIELLGVLRNVFLKLARIK